MINGIKTAILPTKIRPANRYQYKFAGKGMPCDFNVGSVFSLPGDKILVFDKSFSKNQILSIIDVVRENLSRASMLEFDRLFIVPVSIKFELYEKIKERASVIAVDVRQPTNVIKAEVYKVLVGLIDSVYSENELIIRLTHNDPRFLWKNRNSVQSSISGALNPSQNLVAGTFKYLKGEYDVLDIESFVSLLPREILDKFSVKELAPLVWQGINFIKTEKDQVYVRRFNPSQGAVLKDLVEIFIVSEDYYGLSHDVASIFSVLGITPLNFRAFEVKGKKNMFLLRSISSIQKRVKRGESLSRNIKDLLKEDRNKIATLRNDGEKLWFSFHGVYNSIARLMKSVDKDKFPVENTLNVLKKHYSIMLALIDVFRIKHDPVCFAEYPSQKDERYVYKQIEREIESLRVSGKTEDANILLFAFDFIKSVKKTDYFDFRRLKELFTFVLDFSFLSSYFDKSIYVNPKEIIYLYRKNMPTEILPIYSIERRTDTQRYQETGQISEIQDASLSTVLQVRGTIHDAQMRSVAENILQEPVSMTPKDFNIFEGLRFIDSQQKKHSIQSIEQSGYFAMVASALFRQVDPKDGIEHRHDKYLYDISEKLGLSPLNIHNVEIEFLGEGGLKNVSKVRVIGPSVTRSFIVGINRREVNDKEKGHCYSEHKVLIENSQKTELLPVPFGFANITSNGQDFGVLFKEFLLGQDALDHFNRIVKQNRLNDLFSSIGYGIGRLFFDIQQGSSDSKLSNIIYYLDRIRFCDICPLTDDMGDVMYGFKQLIEEVPSMFLFDLLEGVLKGGKENRGAEFLGRIRANLEFDTEDAWASQALFEQLNKFAREKGESPDLFFKYD